jgi:hypothetical protein
MDAGNNFINDQIMPLVKKLPWNKWWFYALIFIFCHSAYSRINSGENEIIYDYSALGFSSEQEMRVSFSKGYHTRQKLEEMTGDVGR